MADGKQEAIRRAVRAGQHDGIKPCIALVGNRLCGVPERYADTGKRICLLLRGSGRVFPEAERCICASIVFFMIPPFSGIVSTLIIPPPRLPGKVVPCHFRVDSCSKKAPGEVDLLGGLAFWGDVPEGRQARCGRLARLLPRAGPSSYNLSVSADALPPPLVGEALAVPAK